MPKNLRISKKSSTFAAAFEMNPFIKSKARVRELTKIGDYFQE
jgi:hypothetical protein